MTKFEELRKEVSERIRIENEYWDSIHEAIKEFNSGFFNYLGLESNEIKNSNGHKTGILKIGRNKDGNFEMCPIEFCEKDGKELSFILYLMLPSKESMEVEMSYWTKITVSKPLFEEDAINISTKDMYQPVLCSKETGQLNLEPFYDELFKEIVRNISIDSL